MTPISPYLITPSAGNFCTMGASQLLTVSAGVIGEEGHPHAPGTACDGANGNMHDAVTHNWMGCLKDGEIQGSTTPHNGVYEWPLEVGKSWRAAYTWTDSVIHPEWSGPSWEEWTVVGWEEVTVPAGTFMAYKVVRTKTEWQTKSEDMSIFWYAPEFGAGVKGMTVRSDWDGYGAAEHMWELVSNDPKYLSDY